LNAIDDILLNILVLTFPILLYHIFQQRLNKRLSRRWIGLLGSLAALFCMTHPFFHMFGSNYDLRIIPLLVAFLYAGVESGLLVCLTIMIYSYFMKDYDLGKTLLVLAFLISFFLTFIKLTNWKQISPKVMFPSLLAFLGSLTIVGFSLFYRLSSDQTISANHFIFAAVYCLTHTLTMWMITFLIERIKENFAIQQEVQRSEKLNVLSELAASVAHEIRNPMTVARGFMQILSQSQVTEDKKRMYTSMVIEEIDRAQSIISDYLSFAKPQAEKLEKLDASQLTLKLSNLINPFASLKGAQIIYHMEPELWINAVSEKMIQCLVNLTKNGIEAMPEGGTLQISGYKRASKVYIEIKDNGVGMTPEQIELLGTPFYSTKHKGTGLGMMVSYRIIKTFGGEITVISEPGKGTSFTLSLPTLS
jgi:two-component system, sporulation sensor kinase B